MDTILSYCHYSLNDTSLEGLLPYLKDKHVGVINASVLSMGLLTGQVSSSISFWAHVGEALFYHSVQWHTDSVSRFQEREYTASLLTGSTFMASCSGGGEGSMQESCRVCKEQGHEPI